MLQKLLKLITPKPPLDVRKERVLMNTILPLDGGQTIQKGEFIVPGKVVSDLGRRISALYLVQKDLEFAVDCFEEALEHGIPDAHNLPSRAFVYSGVVAYARPFMSDVREIDLSPDFFAGMSPPFDLETHQYLRDVRSKHIAHSVNEFDYCRTVITMVGTNETGWRVGGGIGVVDTRTIGLSGEMIEKAISHIQALLLFISSQIEALKSQAATDFKEQFAKDRKWEIAPIGHLPNRGKAGLRRSKD